MAHELIAQKAQELNLSIWMQKSRPAVGGFEVPMPKRPTTLPNGVIHSITDQGSPVKPKLRSVTESRQFKRWFGDPKKVNRELVNADGTPKVFYHGTPNGGFTVFKG